MNIQCNILTPTIFPALLRASRAPANWEPPWILNGWIELTCDESPKWRCICETWFDAQLEMVAFAGGDPAQATLPVDGDPILGPLFQALRRGAAVGDELPILGRYHVALSPITGGLVVVPLRRIDPDP